MMDGDGNAMRRPSTIAKDVNWQSPLRLDGDALEA